MLINIKIGKAPVSGLIAALSLVLSAASFAADNINILACEPEWASLAEELGGGHVKVFSATHAKQNPHFIRARPSLISKARRADMIMCSGAGLEAGWLPILIQKGSSRIQPGKPFPSKFTLIKSFYGSVLTKNMWENAKNFLISLMGGGHSLWDTLYNVIFYSLAKRQITFFYV